MPVGIEFAFERAVFLFGDRAPRDPKGTVEKAIPNSAAVRFDVQTRVTVRSHNGVVFEFQARRIGVAGDDAVAVFFADGKGDERASAAYRVIFAALFDFPLVVFVQTDKAVPV